MTPPPARRARPFGVSVLAALALVSGAIGVSLGSLAIVVLFFGQASAEVVSGILTGIIGAVTLAFAWGAWLLRPWAWRLGVIFWSMSSSRPSSCCRTGKINSNVVVAPVCLGYLLLLRVRLLFRR